jgi:hypothetical protein
MEKMKWFYVIPKDAKKIMFCEEDNLKELGLDEYTFMTGAPIDITGKKIIYRVNKKEQDGIAEDCLACMGLLPLFSGRLIEALEKEGIGGFQYIPVEVYNYSGELIPGYCMANITITRDALDIERSKILRFPETWSDESQRGKLWGVIKYVLKKEELVGIDVCRLSSDHKFVASERFKKVFTKNKFTGYEFVEVETI